MNAYCVQKNLWTRFEPSVGCEDCQALTLGLNLSPVYNPRFKFHFRNYTRFAVSYHRKKKFDYYRAF
jgi:hypothetical protein